MMLGRIRLAWWRETLEQPASARPKGDAVLDAVALHWPHDTSTLVQLVDAWEVMLHDAALTEPLLTDFAKGRIAPIVQLLGANNEHPTLEATAMRWAYADAATKVSSAEERELCLQLGLAAQVPVRRLGKKARGIAVLGALAQRSLDRGGQTLMQGRGAAIIAIKAAIFGR